jgi:hypothetical protein
MRYVWVRHLLENKHERLLRLDGRHAEVSR